MINLNLILLDLVWICGFSMSYEYDNDTMVGVLLLYIRSNIPTKFLKHYLELILKICQLKLIYKKESGFLMALTICIKTNF